MRDRDVDCLGFGRCRAGTRASHVSWCLGGLVAAVLAVSSPLPAHAQAQYPAKPVRIIVPFLPGGGTDILARVVGQKMSESLGQPVLVENKPGAGGNIGIDMVVQSPADGYTIGLGQTSNLAVNVTLYPGLPYNPIKDLVPIGLVASAPLVVVTRAASPFRTIGDVVAAAKAKPDDVNFASPGNGTVAHLSGELLQQVAGVRFSHIPYKGAAQAMTDILGGQVHIYMSSIPSALSQIKGGKLRALAVTSPKRTAELPDVPTLAESGFPGFETSTWFGLVAPARTPKPIVERLNAELAKALQDANVRQKIAAEGAEVLGGSAAEFGALIASDIERWGKIVKSSGAKID